MLRFGVGVVCNAVALWVAIALFSGLQIVDSGSGAGADQTGNGIIALLLVALVFSVVNAVVKSIVSGLALPLTVITLVLFHLVVNAAMLGLTAWATGIFDPLGIKFEVSGFWSAFFGAIVIGWVNWALSLFLPDGARR